MKDRVLNWLVDTMARTEILDLYFVVTDLIVIPQTPAELAERGHYDAMCIRAVNETDLSKNSVPIGKLVI
jgi:hypothetical protein